MLEFITRLMKKTALLVIHLVQGKIDFLAIRGLGSELISEVDDFRVDSSKSATYKGKIEIKESQDKIILKKSK